MFPIQATVTLNNGAQLAAFNAFITGGGAVVDPATIHVTAATVSKDAPPARVTAEAKKPAAETAPAPSSGGTSGAAESAAPSDTGASSGDTPARTVDDAKALTKKIVADKGREAAVALLTKYNVPVAAKLPADQVEAFCADADKVLAS